MRNPAQLACAQNLQPGKSHPTQVVFLTPCFFLNVLSAFDSKIKLHTEHFPVVLVVIPFSLGFFLLGRLLIILRGTELWIFFGVCFSLFGSFGNLIDIGPQYSQKTIPPK